MMGHPELAHFLVVFHESSRPKTRPSFTPQMVVVNSKGNGTPKISGKSRLVKYYSIWPDTWRIIPVGVSGDPITHL